MGRSVVQSAQEYARGIAGGLLFSLPLIYTMEMWQAGFSARPRALMALLCVSFVLLLGYNRFAGLRDTASLKEVAVDSVEEMGLGLVIAAVLLFLTGRIDATTTWREGFGQIIIEAIIVAIGVSIGTAQLGGNVGDAAIQTTPDDNKNPNDSNTADDTKGNTRDNENDDDDMPHSFEGQMVIALCGAVLFGANVAPTEEILIIAVEAESWQLICLALASFVFGAVLLLFSDFRGSHPRGKDNHAPPILTTATTTYAIALVSGAAILWFFGRFEGESWQVCIAQIVVLGVATTLGASAGRLLLQVGTNDFQEKS